MESLTEKWNYDSDDNNTSEQSPKEAEDQKSNPTKSRSRSKSFNNEIPERYRSKSPKRNNFRNTVEKPRTEPNCCIGVFALSKDTENKTLWDTFEKFGKIETVKLIMDRDKNESLGFAFITYENLESATTAVKDSTGMNLDGSTIRVDFSKKRRPFGETSDRRSYDFNRNSNRHEDGEKSYSGRDEKTKRYSEGRSRYANEKKYDREEIYDRQSRFSKERSSFRNDRKDERDERKGYKRDNYNIDRDERKRNFNDRQSDNFRTANISPDFSDRKREYKDRNDSNDDKQNSSHYKKVKYDNIINVYNDRDDDNERDKIDIKKRSQIPTHRKDHKSKMSKSSFQDYSD